MGTINKNANIYVQRRYTDGRSEIVKVADAPIKAYTRDAIIGMLHSAGLDKDKADSYATFLFMKDAPNGIFYPRNSHNKANCIRPSIKERNKRLHPHGV